VHLDASITGPAPWHVRGHASLSLWLFSVSVGFDVTFGPVLSLVLAPLDPWPVLLAAIEDVRNWSSALGANAHGVVTARAAAGESAAQLLDPGGAATLRQTVLPLNRTITRFGTGKPSGPDRYAVDSVAVNGTAPSTPDPVTDFFAAAQFEELSDTEKLSRPSFERMDAGFTVAANSVAAGPPVGASVEFETIIIDIPWEPRRGPRYALPLTHQLAMLEQGASAQAPLRTTGLGRFSPPATRPSAIAMDDERYVVATTTDATPFAGVPGAFAKGAALNALARHLRAHPELAGQLQVMPEHEAAAS
jgi:hypothetical protein